MSDEDAGDEAEARAAAERAAHVFGRVVELMATPTWELRPSVMFRVVGLLGALLVHYSEYDFEEVVGEIRRVAGDEEHMQDLMRQLVKAGLLPPEVLGDGEGLH